MTLILTLFNLNKEVIVETDISDYVIGAYLNN
jgi:hypothetical protein